MSLQFLKENPPLVIIYPAGAGGEFISKTIANNSPSFNNLEYLTKNDTNQTHSRSIVRYSSMWQPPDVDTIIDFKVYDSIDKSLRNITKDHPSVESCNLHKKYIPFSEILYIAPVEKISYFCKLAYIKLAELVKTPINKNYFLTNVNDCITDEKFSKILDLTNKFPEVWKHEIDILNTQLSSNDQTNIVFEHNHDLTDVIYEAIKGIKQDNYLKTVMPLYKNNFSKFKFINTDTLTTSSKYFWSEIEKIIPDIDIESSILSTDQWINENELLCKH